MNVVDEVKQRVDIVELISRYTQLKKAGASYKGLCPFHSERTPSFVVFPHTGTWHCFGACGDGGDAFSFLMKKENLDFREALELLAREVGVQLEEADNDPERKHREELYQVNAAAATFFQEILATHPQAIAAREYLNRRQIDQATAEQFQIGFALDGWDHLYSHLRAKGFKDDLQIQAGLLKHNVERNRSYDAFRNRVIIPIRDRRKHIIGFGGRVLGDEQPKYLNTAETPIFTKSRVVFGLDLAYRAIADQDKVVIVEGYMDVIAAHQHGHTNTVACMGTAVTADQLQQLQRFTHNFVLALDADAAGQQATLRALNQARQALARVSKPRLTPTGRVQLEEMLAANLFILSMPDGRDPDDVIRQAPESWTNVVDAAKPLVDYYFDIVADQYDLETPQGKGAAVTELVALIAELGDEIERQHYSQQLSRLVRINEQTIEARVQAAAVTLRASARMPSRDTGQPPQPSRSGLARPAGQEPARSQRSTPVRRTDAIGHEDHLMANLLHAPHLLIWLAGVVDKLEIAPLAKADLHRIENQEILLGLKQYLSSDEPWDPEAFQEQLTEHLHGQLGRLVAYGIERPQTDEAALREDTIKILLRIREQGLKEQSEKIRHLLDDAQVAGDTESIQRYKTASNQLLRELSHLYRTQGRLNDVLFERRQERKGVIIRPS